MDEKQKVILQGLVQELRRGVIVLAALSCLEEAAYGYSLVAKLKAAGLDIEANTLYPLLRRLEGQGLLSSTWDTDTAKPRKYYIITPQGKEILSALKKQWLETNNQMRELLEESK